MKLHEVLDMVGGAFDEEWIDTSSALELLTEHGHVTRERALTMLVTADPGTEVDRDDDGTWTP